MTTTQSMTQTHAAHYGKYRGTVMSNVDPEMRGKLLVSVPGLGLPTPVWAEGCFPVTGTQAGMFSVPEIGAGVWVEFEQGHLDHPIWVGSFQTRSLNSITISDTPGPTGGVLIKTTTGAMISVSDVGIVISNGKGATISMLGPTVDVNAGALTVI
jgi:hypothetical protein